MTVVGELESELSSQADAVHLQPGHQLPEGLRTLTEGHVGWQGRGADVAGLALPALDAKVAEVDQVTGTGAAAAPGAGG